MRATSTLVGAEDVGNNTVQLTVSTAIEVEGGAFEDPRANVIIGDALAYIKQPGTFDAIISDLTEPLPDSPSPPEPGRVRPSRPIAAGRSGGARLAMTLPHIWGKVGADMRWVRAHGGPRLPALIARSLTHHLFRTAGALLGARADGFPERMVWRLSLERRGG